MSARQADRQRLASLVGGVVAGRDPAGLCRFLTAHSGLPGPRAHLELAQAFADLAGLSADEAPTSSPGEFLPFCGALAIGAIGAASSAPSPRARGKRWRRSRGGWRRATGWATR